MTAAILAEAAQADREADAIFERMAAAAKPSVLGGTALIPPGFRGEAQRASDLRRRAAHLRAEAAELTSRPSAAPSVASGAAETLGSSTTMPTSTSAAPSPPFASGAADTVEAVAARICASDAPRPVTHPDLEVEAIAARICASDAVAEADTAEAIARRIISA